MAEDLVALVGLKTDPATVDQSDAAVLGCIPWMRTRVELHALHLLALEELYPEDKSTEQAADWLLAARRGFRWNPEKANGPAVMALAEWFSRAKFESEKYTLTVQVNDKDVDTANHRRSVCSSKVADGSVTARYSAVPCRPTSSRRRRTSGE